MKPGDVLDDLAFLRPDGTAVRLSELSARPLILIFLRHLACSACRDHLLQVQEKYAEIRGLGADVLVVSFSKPASVAAYLAHYSFAFPIVADPSLTAYNTFALGRTSWIAILHPGVLFRYFKIALRGRWPHWPSRDEDVLQLGGDFVLDEQRRLVHAHPCTEPTDRPPVDELIKAIPRRSEKG